MRLALAIVAFAFTALFSSPSFAEKRLALVIGNDTYQRLPPVSQLERAGQDAQSVGNVLESIGFTVLRGKNLPRRQMLAMIRQLRDQIKPGDVALFFFAGHGVAIDGTNYLLPTDIRPSTEARIAQAAIPETRIERDLLEAGARTGIMILDACRNNPFPVATRRSTGKTRGLATSRATPGIFKMFSAGTGEAAIEQLGVRDYDPNSLFTRVLLDELPKPNQSLIDVTYAVKRRVLALSEDRQNPAYYDGGFANDVFLAGRPPKEKSAPEPPQPPAEASPPPCTGSSAHFAVAQKLNTRAALEAHLGFYGHCPYAPFARGLLDGMEDQNSAPEVVLAVPPKVEGASELGRIRAAVQSCDRLAASGGDRMRPRGVSGVEIDDIDSGAAIAACGTAVAGRPGDPRMQFQLGRALEASGAPATSVAEAYGKAADLGSHLAQARLGGLHLTGKAGVPRDFDKALSLLREAADHNVAVAQTDLGSMYEKGLGVPGNFAEALFWYERAASAGHIAAHGDAARILTGSGYGKITHFARAADHWREAAAAGDSDAAFKLAIAIRDSQVEARSAAEMMESFDAAARTGRADALIAIAEVHLQHRDYRDALNLAYRAYDISSKAGLGSENGWLPLQFLSASLVVKIVRQARTLPRSQREFNMFRQDYDTAGLRELTVPATCGGTDAPLTVYAWNWSRDTDMVTPQLEWLKEKRGCEVPVGIAASFKNAFDTARRRDVGYSDLILTTLRDARNAADGAASDDP